VSRAASTLSTHGAIAALRWQFRDRAAQGLICSETIPETEMKFIRRRDRRVRVAQEALMNVMKHAEATRRI